MGNDFEDDDFDGPPDFSTQTADTSALTPGDAERPTAARPPAHFAYHTGLEKYVLRKGNKWDITGPVTEKGLQHFLVACGLNAAAAKATIITKRYPIVVGHKMAPGQKPLVMDPEEGFYYLNAWTAPRLSPAPGEYPLIQRVLEWLTKGDKEGVRWLTHWMAAKVQNPTLVPKVAVVTATQPGGGKGTLAHVMREMLGKDNTETVEGEALENRFNLKWAGKLFIFGDEIRANEKTRDISQKLKGLISEKEIEQEGKGSNQRTIRNYAAWMFASNSEITPVVVERGDRRYAVFTNHDDLPADYIKQLDSAFESDRATPTAAFDAEVRGFWAYLLGVAVDRQWISRPYNNEPRKALIEASMPTHDMFFTHVQEHGINDLIERAIKAGGDWSWDTDRGEWDFGERGLAKDMVYKCYQLFARENGGQAKKKNKFGMAIQNRDKPWGTAKLANKTKDRVPCYVGVQREEKKDKKEDGKK